MDNEIKKALWATADKLRSNMDAAEYKHIVLGLIFLKYISDSFAEHRARLEKRFADANESSTTCHFAPITLPQSSHVKASAL